MKYNFSEMTDRRNTFSMKWDVAPGELPMWVADMDFRTAPEIIGAVLNKAKQGILGYTIVPDEWYEAVAGWWRCRHHLDVQKEWLIFCTGVVPAVSSAVRKLTTVGEKIVVQTPVYNIFFNSIYNNGRNILENRLIYENGAYRVDFEDLEKKLSDPQTSMMILCNPHNPIGKIWDRDTLARIGELCAKYHVLVLSDEIHCDLTDPGCEYIPFASVSEACAQNSITAIAPTKAFNIAGLQTAAVMVPNPLLRHRMWRGLNTDEVAEPNALAMEAAIAAFTKGEEWLDELREYLAENKKTADVFIKENIPVLFRVPSQATYLLWIDCSRVTEDATALRDFIRQKTGLYLSEGEEYGTCGKAFLRMNIACPRERLLDGLQRLKEGTEAYMVQS